MKKLKFVILLSLVSATVSCSILEEKNPTQLTGVYNSEVLLEADVAGITLDHFFRSAALERFGSASGITTWGLTGDSKYNQNDFIYCMSFTVLSTASENRNLFIGQYRIIQRANTIISNLSDSPVDEAYKLEIEAECRLYRAIAYFNLARYYGDVPLRLLSPTAEDASKCPRTPYYEIYDQVIRDLKFAEQYMRTPERVRQLSPKDFRPNKYAATAYLSSVYTHIGSLLSHPEDNFWDNTKPERKPRFESVGSASEAYALALKYAKMVIPDSGTHIPECEYKLVEKISDLYQFDASFSRNGYTSWRNPEQIMITSCSIESANTDYYTRNTVPNFCPGTQQTKSSDNTARVRPSRFLFEKWCSEYPGERGTGKFAEIYVSSSDPRVAATLWYGTLELSDGSTITTYPKSTTVGRKTSMPYYRKYWSPRFTGSYGDSDYYDLRLAEVYLNAAEAAASLDKKDSALFFIGKIHERARHSVPDGEADAAQPDWSGRTFSDKEDLLRAIFWERIFELAGEGHDFTDTHRFGAGWLKNEVAVHLNTFYKLDINASLFGGKAHYAPGVYFLEDETLLRKSLLVPIPPEEVLTNSLARAENDFWWGL